MVVSDPLILFAENSLNSIPVDSPKLSLAFAGIKRTLSRASRTRSYRMSLRGSMPHSSLDSFTSIYLGGPVCTALLCVCNRLLLQCLQSILSAHTLTISYPPYIMYSSDLSARCTLRPISHCLVSY